MLEGKHGLCVGGIDMRQFLYIFVRHMPLSFMVLYVNSIDSWSIWIVLLGKEQKRRMILKIAKKISNDTCPRLIDERRLDI